MADKTKIEWADATWNVITGCSVVSPGCANCYAMHLAGGKLKNHMSREGLTEPSKAGPVWNGKVRWNAGFARQPLHWQKPRRIFVCAHGDLFHESVPFDWIDGVCAVMYIARQHTYLLLTKRSARMREYFSADDLYERWAAKVRAIAPQTNSTPGPDWYPRWVRNWWLGVSVEDQQRANERIPDLIATPAAVRWISAEPLLGPIDFDGMWVDHPDSRMHVNMLECLDWVEAGGESAQNKPGRPMHPDWPRGLRDQCQAAGVAFGMKQWGDWMPVRSWSPGPPFADEIAILPDGSRVPHDVVPQDVGGQRMRRVGKGKAGDLLDGRAWHDQPERRPS